MATKGRALVWDDWAGQGAQSRRGPIRDIANYSNSVMEWNKRLANDLCYLKKNADTIMGESIIYEGDKHWEGLTDTMFDVDPNPICV